jgi:hypothetical protein
MFTIDKYDPKTNKLTVTFQLNATPRETDKMLMFGGTPGFQDTEIKIGGKTVRLSANIGCKK